jgi:arginine decarboxylase
MQHNLFTHPTEAVINFHNDGSYTIDNLIEAQNLMDILDDLDYDTDLIDETLKDQIKTSEYIRKDEKKELLDKLYLYLSENSYLKTIQAQSHSVSLNQAQNEKEQG